MHTFTCKRWASQILIASPYVIKKARCWSLSLPLKVQLYILIMPWLRLYFGKRKPNLVFHDPDSFTMFQEGLVPE